MFYRVVTSLVGSLLLIAWVMNIVSYYKVYEGPRQVLKLPEFGYLSTLRYEWANKCYTAAQLSAGSFVDDVSEKVTGGDGLTCANATVNDYYFGLRDEYLYTQREQIWEQMFGYIWWASKPLEADFNQMVAAAGGQEYVTRSCTWLVDWAIWSDYNYFGRSGSSMNVRGILCDNGKKYLLTY